MIAFAPRKSEKIKENISQLKKEPQIIMKTQSMNAKKNTLISIFDDDNKQKESKKNINEMTATQFMKNVNSHITNYS